MMWVGDRSLSSTDSTSGEDFPTDRGQSGKKLWSQGSWFFLQVQRLVGLVGGFICDWVVVGESGWGGWMG